jgi:hypothetical protein
MNAPVADQPRTCRECGAVVTAEASQCWLCSGALAPEAADAQPAEPSVASAQAPPDYQGRAALQFGLSSLMLVMTLFAVICGVFSISPGIGLAVCIVAAPALVRTCLVVARRKSRGRSVSGVQKTGMYLGSFLVTAIILSILGVVAFGTFFGVCLGVALGELADIEAAMALAIMAAVVMTALVAWPLALWVRRRWRKAVRDKNGGPRSSS